MPIITYPLNGVTYDASDAETYLSTRKSGVYSAEDHFGITMSGSMEVTISPGLAWINNAEFRGKSIVSTEPVVLTIPMASGVLPRRDLIVLRFDASANRSYFAVKQGTESTSPSMPSVQRTSSVYELGLYSVYIGAGALSISSADITSLLLDENYCGVMRDGVTGIPTSQIQAQAMEIISGLIASLNSQLSDIVGASVTKDMGSGQAYCDVRFSEDGTRILFDFHNIEGADGISVTHSWSGNTLTITSASGTTNIDFGAIKYYKELVRFTSSGTFNPSSYPTVDGKYDILLQGGGGSGAYGSEANKSTGGESGGIFSLNSIPLRSGVFYPVKIGAGGQGIVHPTGSVNVQNGKAGGDTYFAGFFAPGGRGGVYGGDSSFDTPTVSNGFTHEVGTSGTSGKGGDSLLALSLIHI